MLRTKILLAALAMATSMSVNAQSLGNGFGTHLGQGWGTDNGYRVDTPDGGSTCFTPDYNGGYIIYDPNGAEIGRVRP
jgi:hypothetical protein